MPSKLVLQESFFEYAKSPLNFKTKIRHLISYFPPSLIVEMKEKLLDKGKTNYNSPARSRGRSRA